eukprot:762857-Rhodomonas_salina.1
MGVVVGNAVVVMATGVNSRTASCDMQNSTAELWVCRWHTRSLTQPRSSTQPLPLPLSARAWLLSFFCSSSFACSL